MQSIDRVREFLRQHRSRQGHDPILIQTIYTDVNADPAPLLAPDLDYLVQYAVRTHVVVAITNDRTHVYGPFTSHKANRCKSDLVAQSIADQIECKIEVRPLIDIERKNLDLQEKREERKGGR